MPTKEFPSIKDTFIILSSPDTVFYLGSVLTFGYGGGNSTTRSILAFDLTDLLDLEIVTGTLRITTNSGAIITTNTTSTIHKLNRSDWTETAATWNKYNGINNWITAGGDFVDDTSLNTVINNDTEFSDPGAVKNRSFNITNLCKDAITNENGVLNLLFKAQEIGAPDGSISIFFDGHTGLHYTNIIIKYLPTVARSLPAGDRGTHFSFHGSLSDSIGTQWELLLNGITYTYNTMGDVIASPNVLSSSKTTINLWLPPFQSVLMRGRSILDSSFGEWSSWAIFESRGTFNSYENFQALNANTQTIIGRI